MLSVFRALPRAQSMNFHTNPHAHSEVEVGFASIHLDHKNLILRADNKEYSFNTRWLRDFCKCEKCFQRSARSLNWLNNLKDSSTSTSLEKAEWIGKLEFSVQWSDDHKSIYRLEDILAARGDKILNDGLTTPWIWDTDSLQSYKIEHLSYEDVITENQKLKQLHVNLLRFGFAFIKESPVEHKSMTNILDKIGGTMQTVFSDHADSTEEMRANDDQHDLGWSSSMVPAHTDNSFVYDTSAVVGLHLLKHENGTGGELALVDGYSICRKMSIECPKLLSSLITYPVIFKYHANSGIKSRIDTVVRMDPLTGIPIQIRWNPLYMIPVLPGKKEVAVSEKKLNTFYEAFQYFFNAIHLQSQNRFEFTPKCGEIVLIDNWRLIHERSTGFTGDRVMHVGDVSRDSWMNVLQKNEIIP